MSFQRSMLHLTGLLWPGVQIMSQHRTEWNYCARCFIKSTPFIPATKYRRALISTSQMKMQELKKQTNQQVLPLNSVFPSCCLFDKWFPFDKQIYLYDTVSPGSVRAQYSVKNMNPGTRKCSLNPCSVTRLYTDSCISLALWLYCIV